MSGGQVLELLLSDNVIVNMNKIRSTLEFMTVDQLIDEPIQNDLCIRWLGYISQIKQLSTEIQNSLNSLTIIQRGQSTEQIQNSLNTLKAREQTTTAQSTISRQSRRCPGGTTFGVAPGISLLGIPQSTTSILH